MQAARYTDDDESMDMEDVEDYSNDYYETQPGDLISNATNHRRINRNKSLSLILLTFGALLVVGGIFFAMHAMEAGKESSGSSQAVSPAEPLAIAASPARSPVTPPSRPENEPHATLGHTEQRIADFIEALVGKNVLANTDSLAYKALRWLEETHDAEQYGNDRLQQRFAMACLYLATTKFSPWKNDEGWMTAKDECSWYGASCHRHELVALNLTDNGLEGVIPWETTFLGPHLLSLEIAGNELVNTGDELAWIGELTNLRLLDIARTFFAYNGVPLYISYLTNLKILDMAETLFIGELDGTIFEPLAELKYLEMGGNMYNSTFPSQIYELQSLEALYAYESGIRGNIGFLPELTGIVELWLDQNPGLTGTIPTHVRLMSKLASLSLSNCGMSGQIPSQFGKLTMLEQAWFFGNWFSGTIPTEFAALPKLQILGLEDNNITKVAMPQELCQKEMLALSADCGGDTRFIDCDCCTCCEAPCPIVNLPPVFEHSRRLLSEEIRRQ